MCDEFTVGLVSGPPADWWCGVEVERNSSKADRNGSRCYLLGYNWFRNKFWGRLARIEVTLIGFANNSRAAELPVRRVRDGLEVKIEVKIEDCARFHVTLEDARNLLTRDSKK